MNTFIPYADAPSPCHVVNNAFSNWGHEFLFDESTLSYLLAKCGFVDVKRQALQFSSCPELAGVDFHGQCIADADFNAFESMILEARKPG